MLDIDPKLAFMVATSALILSFGAFNAWVAPIDDVGTPNSYTLSINAVVEAARQEPRPKLILAGGSNAMVGLRAELISAETGLPVINAGISSMMGSMTSYADVLSAIVKHDDIVVLSASEWVASNKLSGLHVSRRRAEALTAATGIPFFASDAGPPRVWLLVPERPLVRWLVPVRAVQENRRFGNEQTCLAPPRGPTALTLPTRPLSAEGLAATRRLAQIVRARGGTIYFSLPWVLVKARDLERWRARNAQLKASLEEIAPVLESLPDQTLQTRAELFCDGPTHLLEPASRLRSRELARSISALRGNRHRQEIRPEP